MKKMLKVGFVAAVIMGVVILVSCGQNPAKNPLVAKKFKEIADLTERVQTLEDRFSAINADIETILDDMTLIKQDIASVTDVKKISDLAERLGKVESQIKAVVSTRRVERVAERTSPKVTKAAEKPSGEKVTSEPSRDREKEYVVPKGFYHEVKAGETLDSLAIKYGLSKSKIAEENRLPSSAKLIPGQRIFIPKQK
jgi:LysM repeat protein